MATLNEKSAVPHDVVSQNSGDRYSSPERALDIPHGRKYKQIKIGPWTLPWYASPQIQIIIVGFVCFLCPGMFNALSGMGGGGNIDHRAADDANCALYATFAFVGFFAGTITNRLGVKAALSFGGLGYCIYIASFLSYAHNQNYGFTVFAGFLLGVCAGLLWCAQGTIMMSYPNEAQKGRAIFTFWGIFNMGGVIGALIPLGQNINITEKRTVSDGTYIGFLVLAILGALLAWTLVDAHDVVRADGSKVILQKNPTWKTELLGLLETFKTDPYIVFLFPMFFSSNWFYTYQFNDFNGARFTTRTSALNNVLYWTMQIVGSFIFGWALDRPSVSRSMRGKLCWVALFVLTMAIWGGGYAFQDYTRPTTPAETAALASMDWTSSGYGGSLVLYMMYGFFDAAWQTSVYWYMGAMTNNGRKLANFAGFYKGIQSAGAAIIWRLDSLAIPYINVFASSWALLAGSLLIALPLIMTKIHDSVPVEEDLKFSDETIEDTHVGKLDEKLAHV